MNKHLVQHQLPSHFVDYYPKFIKFIELYYEWMSRHGMSPDEITNMVGSGKYDIDEMLEIMEQTGPLQESNEMYDNYLLKQTEEEFITADGYEFYFADDEISANRKAYFVCDNDKHISQWYNFFNFPRTQNYYVSTFGKFLDASYRPVVDSNERNLLVATFSLYGKYRSLNHTLLLKLLRSIYEIKGTEKCISLFFYIFFGEPVNFIYPKHKLSVIDNNMVIDGDNIMRDDDVNQEYSIVVETMQDPSEYDYLLNKIYKPIFHPAGFGFVVRKRS